MEENRNEPNKPIETPEQNEGPGEQYNNRFEENPYAAQPDFSRGAPAVEERIKHSGLGIASFIIALAAILLGIIGIILSVVFAAQVAEDPAALIQEAETMSGAMPEGFGSIMIAGLLMFAGAGLAFVGLILGIIGAFAKNRRKIFAILGLIFNGLIVLGIIGMMLIGLVAGASAI